MSNKWKTKEILLYAISFSNMKKTGDIYETANKIVKKMSCISAYACICAYISLWLTGYEIN